MDTYRRKCHDWRLFIATTVPGAPTPRVFAQVRAGYSDELRSRPLARRTKSRHS